MDRLKEITLQSWLEDFQFALRQQGGSQDINLLPPKLEDYLSVRYEPESLQHDVLDRLKYALLWFWDHQELLESENLAGKSPRPYIKNAVIYALLDGVSYFPPPARAGLLSTDPQVVVRSARQYLADFPDDDASNSKEGPSA